MARVQALEQQQRISETVDALFADALSSRGLEEAPAEQTFPADEPQKETAATGLLSFAMPQSDAAQPGRMFFKAFTIIVAGSFAGMWWDWNTRMEGKKSLKEGLEMERTRLLELLKEKGIDGEDVAAVR